MQLLVIVPAFNEAANVSAVVHSVRDAVPAADVCVVDDGSVDETARVAQAAGARVLRNPMNLGIGGAMQTGYLWAARHGYDVAVQIDGDGQHDPAFIAEALRAVESGADLVVGSRFLAAGGFRSSAVRRLGIRYLRWFLRLRCGVDVTDPTSGFRVTNRRAIELFAQRYPSDYPEPEAIALARSHGLEVVEIPVVMRERQHGASSIGTLRTLYYFLKVSLALALLPSRSRGGPYGEA